MSEQKFSPPPSLLSATGKMVLAPPVQVSLEDASLQRSITEFGRVTLPGSLSHDDLMPLEEYGDVEHHVLHKVRAIYYCLF